MRFAWWSVACLFVSTATLSGVTGTMWPGFLSVGVLACACVLLWARDKLFALFAPTSGVGPRPALRKARGGPYRAPPSEQLIEQALWVTKEVLARGHIAHVLAIEGAVLIQAHSAVDGRTVLGSVSLPEIRGTLGHEIAPFLVHLDHVR